MFILMHIGGMPFNGETIPSGKSLGGSDSAGYYMARELVKLGHKVDMFTNTDDKKVIGGKWDGVNYHWMGETSEKYPLGDRFKFISDIPHDVCIIQRHPLAFAKEINSKINIWWVHDLALKRSQRLVYNMRWNIDAVFPVSKWHGKQLSNIYDIPESNIIPTSNAFDYSQLKDAFGLYKGKIAFPEREEKSLIYAARPERGLINLVEPGGIMEMLPDYTLYVCGYDNVTAHMKSFYQYLYDRCEELPNVKNVGYLSKRDLLELMAKCKAYVYPTEFEETFCTMVLEANAVGTPFIGTKAGALSSTLNDTGGVLWSSDLKISNKKGREDFAQFVKYHCENENKWQTMHRHALKRRLTWEEVAKQWEDTFLNIFKEKTKDKFRLAKHFEKYSDIVAADEAGIINLIPDVEKNYYFYFDQSQYEDHYKRYYQYEADRGVDYGPESIHGNPRFEQVLELVDYSMNEIIGENKNRVLKILDYGCAHGHYTMNILERVKYKNLFITGVDIEKTNIDKAGNWAKKSKEDRANFICGNVGDIPKEKYDIILLGEILEHVPYPIRLLNGLNKFCHSNTKFIITLPYGPWESLGYYEHIGWRAHLHHFERADCEDIFGEQKDYKLFGVPSSGFLGSWVVYYTFSETEYGEIDYRRKELIQNPQETISATIIAKDAQDSIGKTIKTISPYINELVIGVDKTSSDEFKDYMKRQFYFIDKICSVEIDCPIEVGFDIARNETIKHATMDWILWIDSDEVIDYPEEICKYLRNNCITAYSVNQVHVATQPRGELKTDFPTRIFRNHKDIKFFGFVHEHPEFEMNKGIGEVFIMPEVSILHTGYISEKVRRKRFERNFPLMVKDRKKYPDRRLGKFLWLRDITHMNRYERERNGNKITANIQKRAEEALELWRDLFEIRNTRFIVEGLGYYSENVTYLAQDKGFEFNMNMDLKHPSSGGNSNFSQPIKGYFINLEDIQKLQNYMLEELTNLYKEKYL